MYLHDDNGEPFNAETFDHFEYLASRVPDARLLQYPEGRRTLTRLDPMLFALIYCRDLITGEGGSISFSDLHLELCRVAQTWVVPAGPQESRHAFIAPRGCGKAVTLDTPLPTPDGWTTMGKVQVGDLLIDESGKPTVVTMKSAVEYETAYRVHFNDGTSVVTHDKHQWLAVDMYKKEQYFTGRIGRKGPRTGKPVDWRDHWDQHTKTTTREMYENLRFGKRGDLRWRIPVNSALDMPAKDLPIDPYILGYWLGDGNSADGRICIHRDDYEDIKDLLGEHSYQAHSQKPHLYMVLPDGLRRQLRELGLLGNKHVPMMYLRSSIEQRRELVRGLMDSDGYRTHSTNCEISLSDPVLADGVVELFRSLGLKTTRNINRSFLNGEAKKDRHRIRCSFDFHPFHLPRYEEIPIPDNQRSRLTAKTVVNIEKLGPQEMQCVEVDSPHHLYLCGDGFTPTHNSTFAFKILPMWAAAHGHLKFVAAFSHSATQAQTHLLGFKRMLDTNVLIQEDYPDLCEPARRANGNSISDSQEMYYSKSRFTIAAKGLDSGVLGLVDPENNRPDGILLDDVEPDESNYTPYKAGQRLTTICDTVFPMNINAHVTLVGTVTMPDSIVHELVKSVVFPEEPVRDWVRFEKFKVHYIRPIITRDDGSRRSVWPGKWPLEWLESQERSRSFKKNFLNLPLSGDEEYWSDEDFKYGELPDATRVLLQIDPAVTSKRTSDQTAFAVVAYRPPRTEVRDNGDIVAIPGKCEVRDIIGVRKPPEELRAVALRLLQKYPEIGAIRIEVNQGGDTWKAIFKDMPVKVLVNRESVPKKVRALNLLNFYQKDLVLHRTPFNRLEDQMKAFPNVHHDDLIDAVGAGVYYFMKPKKVMSGTTKTYTRRR